jgi:DNA-binding ferritin-like protein
MEITLENMSFISFLFRNDLHMIHHNVKGIDFLDTHNHFGELYEKALEDHDYFAEHALLTGEISAMHNMSELDATPVYETWQRCHNTESVMTVENAYEYLIENGEDYLEALDLCREYCDKEGWDDICSDIDAIRSFWALEIEYKAKHTVEK